MVDEVVKTEIVETQAIELIERAQIDIQIATAKKYPRDLSVVKKKMLSYATLDEETAQSCFYRLTRQGKSIEGASARLAEIATACYGNIKAAAREISNDGKKVTAQAVCFDLENNVSIAVEVSRRITDKTGKTYSEDMQIMTSNAAKSIALRNAVFKVIPGALTKSVYDQVKQVAIGDQKTLSQRREKAIDAFAKMGVTKEKILAYLGKVDVDGIDLKDVESLLGLFTAIKEGEASIDEVFNHQDKKHSESTAPTFGKKEESNPLVSADESRGIYLAEKLESDNVDKNKFEQAAKNLGFLSAAQNVESINKKTYDNLVANYEVIAKEIK